jgi:aspartate aminotransferase-like enzyme
VWVPEGVEEAPARWRLLEEFGIEIGGGLGPLSGRIWRIGLMGETCRMDNVERLADAIEAILTSAKRAGSLPRSGSHCIRQPRLSVRLGTALNVA